MLTWERTLQESVSMKTLLCIFRKAWNTMWASYLFWRAPWCSEQSWWNCEGQILWQLVRHLHEWTNPFPNKDLDLVLFWCSPLRENKFYATWTPLYGHPTLITYGQFSFPRKAISSLRFNPLGVQMASKETENILLQNFGVADKEHYGYVMAFSVVVNSRYCEKPTRSSFQLTNINFS